MGRAQRALLAARDYLRSHPQEIGRAARSAFGLRVGMPIAALQWAIRELERKGKLENAEISSVPPGIRFAADVDLMRTPIRASAVVYIERVVLTATEMALTMRLEQVDLRVLGDAQTPVAALIRSGALDLSKPGNLAAHLPNLPPVIAEAKDNRIVLDFMRDPKLANSSLARSIVGVLSSFVTVHGVETDADHLDVAFRAFPNGVVEAARSVRRHLVPSIRRLLPAGF